MIVYINPIVARYATSSRIVRLAPGDDFGLYVVSRAGVENDFGTPLAARGTLDEILEFRRSIESEG